MDYAKLNWDSNKESICECLVFTLTYGGGSVMMWAFRPRMEALLLEILEDFNTNMEAKKIWSLRIMLHQKPNQSSS